MRHLSRGRSVECGSFIVDRNGTILGFDRAIEALTGWAAIDVVGRDKGACGTFRLEPSPVAGSAPCGQLYDGEIPTDRHNRSLGLRLNCHDGRVLEVEAVADRLSGPGERARVTVLRVVALSAERFSPPEAERCDPLTLLSNAEAFRSAIADDLRSATRRARPLALILADVDRLRRLNDRWGRDVGNDVLQKVAAVMRVCVSDESRIFHLADDDFAILMPDSGRGDARQQAAALRSTVERYRFFVRENDAEEARVTLSLGAASFPADAENPSDLLERAGEALEEARSMGRNRVWCYLRRPRVPIQVPVFFDGSESLLVGHTRDLSPSGIFVRTSSPIDIGMRCALTFPLPGHDGRVHVIGRVVRTVPPQVTADSEPRPPGMGVEFERFGGSTDRRAIEAFLHRNEYQTLRPENGVFSA